MTKEQVEAGSFCVFSRLKEMGELAAAQTVFCYISVRNEVDTAGILAHFSQMGKKIYVPVVRGKEMFAVRWLPEGETIQNEFGIPEPAGWGEESPGMDVALVPGVVFDRKLGRIGCGGGYYDRWLAANRCISIALAYDFQVVDELPQDAHDRRVDRIVTPGGVIGPCLKFV